MSRFNTAQFDTTQFDVEGSIVPPPVDSATVKIGSYVLQDTSITTEKFTYSAPKYRYSTRGYPRADGAYLESSQFEETRLVLRGSIRKGSQLLLEQEMDNMRRAFATNDSLLVQWADERRYWTVYPIGIDRIFDGREHYHVTFCPWEIELLCLHPYARSAGRETFSGENATASPTTYEIPNAGSAPSQSIVTLTIVTAGTLSKLSWENTTTGEIVTIDNGSAFSNGDTLILNTEDKTITKNSVEIDYTGLLPRVDSGENVCEFTAITGSGYTVAVSERHYRRFF